MTDQRVPSESGPDVGGVVRGTFTVKRGLADMLRGGVIMDVVTADQAKVAEDAGAVAVMALERVPADIRRDGGVARMSDPALIEGIQQAVTIPVMAKARIGHFAEAQVLEALGVDYIDESEVLTPADEAHHIDKWAFSVPFVCGATNLGEALRRISEGAAMIRSKGEAGTGNIVEAVRHLRSILGDIRRITQADPAEQYGWAKQLAAPIGLVQEIAADRPAAGAAVLRRRDRHPGRTPRWSCSSGPRPSSWGRASSRATIRPGWPGPSSRPRPTSATPAYVAKVSTGPRRGHGRPGAVRARRALGRPGLVAPGVTRAVTVGVLALQGDVAEHRGALADLGLEPRPVRRPRRPAPGSTASCCRVGSRRPCPCCSSPRASSNRWPRRWAGPAGVRYVRRAGPAGPIGARRARPTSGRSGYSTARSGATATAASASPSRPRLAAPKLDADLGVVDTALPAVFIRAPVVEAVGAGVEVLGALTPGPGERRPGHLRQGPVLAARSTPS